MKIHGHLGCQKMAIFFFFQFFPANHAQLLHGKGVTNRYNNIEHKWFNNIKDLEVKFSRSDVYQVTSSPY